MKLLTAAIDDDPGGWSWTIPGELVFASNLCSLEGEPNHDPEHDCRSSFIGLASGRATTCARVGEVDHDRAQLLEVVRDFWEGDGTDEEIEADVGALLAAAEPFPVGTFLRRCDSELKPT